MTGWGPNGDRVERAEEELPLRCPACGSRLAPLGEQPERSVRLGYLGGGIVASCASCEATLAEEPQLYPERRPEQSRATRHGPPRPPPRRAPAPHA